MSQEEANSSNLCQSLNERCSIAVCWDLMVERGATIGKLDDRFALNQSDLFRLPPLQSRAVCTKLLTNINRKIIDVHDENKKHYLDCQLPS